MGRRRTGFQLKKQKRKKSYDLEDRTALEIYSREIRDIPNLTAPEEIELARKRKNGNPVESLAARNELVTRTLKFVKYLASQYKRYWGLTVEEFEDLIGYGNIGDINGANKFDDKKGCKYLTPATWEIKAKMLQALTSSGLLRENFDIPVYLRRIKKKIPFFIRQFSKEYNCAPDENELIDYICRSTKHKREIIDAIVRNDFRTTSLDAPIYPHDQENNPSSLVEHIENRKEDRPDHILEARNEALIGRLDSYLSRLPQQWEDILRFRNFYLNDAICERYNTTREAIYFIEDKKLTWEGKKKRTTPRGLEIESIAQLIRTSKQDVNQKEKKALNRLRSMMIFDPDFANESMELKQRLTAFFSQGETVPEKEEDWMTQKKIYSILRTGLLEGKVEQTKETKLRGRKHDLILSYINSEDLKKYISYLPNTRDKEIVKLVYNVDDKPVRKKYKILEGKLKTKTLAKSWDCSQTVILNKLRDSEEMIEYFHHGIDSSENVYQMRDKVVKKYYGLVEKSLGNVQDKTDREILELKYGLNGKEKLPNKKIGEQFGLSISLVTYRSSKGFRQLWESMKLIMHAENYLERK